MEMVANSLISSVLLDRGLRYSYDTFNRLLSYTDKNRTINRQIKSHGSIAL